MKRFGIAIALAVLLTPAVSSAQEFSLNGVKMGMAKEEVDTLWTPLESGDYLIQDSVIFDLKLTFDHRGRLYRLTFSLPIPLEDQYPSNLVTAAFQKQILALWEGDSSVSVNVRTGRGGTAEVTVTDKVLLDELTRHIDAQIQFQLTNILKP